MDELRPGSMLATAIPGGLALVGAPYVSGWLQACLLLIGGVLCCFAVVILFFWGRDTWISQTRYLLDGRDRQLKLAEQITRMNSEQLDYLAQLSHVGRDVDLEGKVYLHGTDAPLAFVAEFLSRYSYRLTPVGTWSEGTHEREWARQVTAVLVTAGIALPAMGNRSAAWAEGFTPEYVAKKLGIQLPHPTVTPPGFRENPA